MFLSLIDVKFKVYFIASFTALEAKIEELLITV